MRKLILALGLLLVSCHVQRYTVNMKAATSGTYKVFSEDAQGTAWAIDDHHLVTAGHLCETFSDHFILISGSWRFQAKSVLWEKSRETGHKDLCLLETEGTLPDPLTLSDRMPRVGEDIHYVGFPLGKYTEQDGKYVGDLDGDEYDWNDAVFSAKCDHGASGSAVFFKRGVWGVLVRLRTDGGFVHDGDEGCVAIPLSDLKKFLDVYKVNYKSIKR